MAHNPHPPRVGTTTALLAAVIAAAIALPSPAHADSWRDRQWHLDFLKAAEVHTYTKGEGVTVAVIDTGVDGNHPDLKGNILTGRDYTGDDNAWNDQDGHGTAMAADIAGHGHGPGGRDGVLGLAPKAKILPIRDHVGAPDEDADRHAAEAIRWALLQETQVINFSAVHGGLSRTIAEALKHDVVVVAGAGNTIQGHLGVQPPANYPGVVTVSGVDRNGNFTDESAQGPEVVLAAPAVDITSAWAGKKGRYATGTGTSDATALVSATAALIRAKYPHLSANGVINRLIRTADDKGPPGRDPQYGYGVINPLRALTADIPDINYNPLTTPTPDNTNTSVKAETPPPTNNHNTNYLLPVLGVLTATTIGLITTGAYLLRRNRRPPHPTHHSQTGQTPPHTGPGWQQPRPPHGPPR